MSSPGLARKGPGSGRSLSTSEIFRRRELKKEPHWRNHAFLDPHEKKLLEDNWNGRHQMHFSYTNPILNPAYRDYFDRPRELREENDPRLNVIRWQSTWALGDGHRYDGAGAALRGSEFGKTPLSPSAARAAAADARRRAGWNGRHHVTHSAANELFIDGQKELFGRFVQPRSKRVLPNKVYGITQHHYPHHQIGHPEGCDDGPTAAELLLSEMDDVPVLPLPGRSLSSGIEPSSKT
mmetsp:Transcript_60299/g.152659  ORF Transcript_60299/g.152659 Transcript_60299/m.152659 type:complete len:237 (+) Transcript_60299:103-813(+)